MVALAVDQGLEVDRILQGSGIAPSLIAQDRSRITADQVASVTRTLWKATGDELFGIGPAPVPHGATRLIGLALVHADDLAAVIERFMEFQRLTPGVPRAMVRTTDGAARITVDTSALRDPDGVITTFLVAAIHRVLGWLVGSRIRLEAVELPQAEPPHTEAYQKVFGAPVFFGADVAAIEFDAELLTAPVVQTEEAWLAYADRAPFDILSQREYGVALGDRVRKILARNLAERVSADEVAKVLAMSPQTLRRRLALEDTSVTEVRDEILRDTAIASLVRGDETIDVLSERLGFSEPSAFRRAFRRWTGSPPRTYQLDGHADGTR